MHFKSTNTFSHFPTFILKWQFSTTTTTSLMGKDMNINHCFMGKSGCKNGSTIYLGVFIKVYCNPRTDWKTITTFLKFPLFYFVNEETHRETYLWNSNFPRSIFSFLLCFLYSTLILMLFLCKKILMKETFFASNIAVVNFHIYWIKYYTTYRYIKWHTTSAPFWYETQK